jgi:hypothetical protein
MIYVLDTHVLTRYFIGSKRLKRKRYENNVKERVKI